MSLDDLTPDKKRELAERIDVVADLEEEADREKTEVETSLELSDFIQELNIVDESEAITKISQEFRINASQARKHLDIFRINT